MAYIFKGAKHPLAYAVLFLSASFFFLNSLTDIKKSNVFPFFSSFLAFTGWLLFSLSNHPPLIPYFYSFSKIIFYFLFLYLLLQNKNITQNRLGTLLVILAVIDVTLLTINYLLTQKIVGHLPGNPLYSSLLISSAFCFILTKLEELSDSKSKIGAFFILAFLIFGLFLLKSRSIFLGIILTSPLLLSRKSIKWFFSICVTGVLLWFLFIPDSFFSFVKFNPLIPELGRLVIWKTSLLAIRDKWMAGWGLGNFENAYYQFQQPNPGVLQYSQSTVFAHNDFLQLIVAGGIPSIIFLVYLIYKTTNWKTIRFPSRNQVRWPLSVAIIYLVTAQFNFPFYLPFNGIVFFAVVYPLFNTETSTSIFNRWNGGGYVAGFIIISFSIFLLLNGLSEINKNKIDLALKLMPFRSDLWYEKALSQKNNQEAIKSLETAVSLNQQNSFIWSRLARTTWSLSPNSTEAIATSFERSVEQAPYHAPFWIDYGFYLLSLNNHSSANACFKRAIALEPRTSLPYFALGYSMSRSGQNQKSHNLLIYGLKLRKQWQGKMPPTPYSAYLFELPTFLSKS